MELFQQQWDCIGKFFQVGIDWWYVIVHIHIFNNIIKYFQWERKQWWKRFLLFTFSRHHYILIFRCIWNDILIVFFFRFPIIHRRCWWLRLSIILSLRQRLVRIVLYDSFEVTGLKKNVDGYWCGSSGGEVIGTRDKSLSGWRRWCTSGSRSSCCFLNTLALILPRYFRCSKLKSIFLTVSPNVNG